MKPPAEILTLAEIFNDRFFQIPDYQRGYSWEDQQLQDLRHDIENIEHKTHKHFTGTLVAAPVPGAKHRYDIVDGQQRLTTLLILLSEIGRKLSEPDELNRLFLNRSAVPGAAQYVLQLNAETREYFTDLIHLGRSPIVKTKSHACLLNARNFFRAWLEEAPGNAARIYSIICEKLGFIFFAPHNDREIGIMFEVINNRGKELSELEKIKNFFIYYATLHDRESLRQTINDKWRTIQENLSLCNKTANDDENRFLRNAYLVFYDCDKEYSWSVYRELKTRYNPNDHNAIQVNAHVSEMGRFVEFLAAASRSYTWFFVPGQFTGSHQLPENNSIDRTLSRLRCHHSHASVLPLYLAVMSSFDLEPLGKRTDCAQQVSELLSLIEILNFRLYILPGIFRRADSKQADLFWFAWEFYHHPDWKAEDESEQYTAIHNVAIVHRGDIFEWLKTEIREMVLRFCPAWRIVDTLTLDEKEEYDYYSWKGLRFLLSSYEEQKKTENKLAYDLARMLKSRDEAEKNEYLSIEHIWARENRSKHFPSYHLQKRRLGNLVLMGLSSNISQQDADIEEKIKQLVFENKTGRGSLDMHQVAELENFFLEVGRHPAISAWQRRTDNYYMYEAMVLADIRENKLVRFALQRWALPGENTDCLETIDSFKAEAEKRGSSYYLREQPVIV